MPTFDFLTAWLTNIYFILLIFIPLFLVINAFKLIIRTINAKYNSK